MQGAGRSAGCDGMYPEGSICLWKAVNPLAAGFGYGWLGAEALLWEVRCSVEMKVEIVVIVAYAIQVVVAYAINRFGLLVHYEVCSKEKTLCLRNKSFRQSQRNKAEKQKKRLEVNMYRQNRNKIIQDRVSSPPGVRVFMKKRQKKRYFSQRITGVD